MKDFKNLKVWNSSRALNKNLFKLTQSLPKPEAYGLMDQSRRASVSIASNIAEGSGRGSDKDFCRFLYMALGSSYELETQLIIMNDIFNVDIKNITSEVISIQKQLQAFIKTINMNI
jgi:four helix bundle protein